MSTNRASSMTARIIADLVATNPEKTCCRKAEVTAMLRFAGGPHATGGQIVILAELDNAPAVRRLRSNLLEAFGHRSDVIEIRKTSGHRYVVRVSNQAATLARQTGLLDEHGDPVHGLPPQLISAPACDMVAAWRGAFLATGKMIERYRSPFALELTCPGHAAALALVGAARRLGISAHAREIRGGHQVQIRDPEEISRLLTRLGAHEALLAWERQTRGQRHRRIHLANFDNANRRRAAHSAATAKARVTRAFEILGDDIHPDHRSAGTLRVEHQHASLEELAKLHDPPTTKDAIAGRIRRLIEKADRRARQLGIPSTDANLTTLNVPADAAGDAA